MNKFYGKRHHFLFYLFSRVSLSSDCVKLNMNSIIGTLGLAQKEKIKNSTFSPNRITTLIGLTFLFLGLSVILVMISKGLIEYSKNRFMHRNNKKLVNEVNETDVKKNSTVKKSLNEKDQQNTINTDISSFSVNSLHSEKLMNKTINTTIETSNWTTNTRLPTICSDFVLSHKENK